MLRYISPLILLLVLLPSLSFSQFEVVLENFGFSKGPSRLYKTSTDKYILINDDESEAESQYAFAIINDDGEQELGILYDGWGQRINVRDVIERPDSAIMISSEIGNFCDLEFDVAISVRKNGNVLDADYGRYFNFGGIFSDNSYMLFYGQPGANGWERKNQNGLTIWHIPRNFSYPDRDMVVTSQDTIVIAEVGGLRLLDKDKNQVGGYVGTSYEFDQLELMEEDIIIARQGYWVYFLSEDFEFVNSLDFETPILDLTLADQQIAILTSDQHAYLYNDTLGLITDFQITDNINYNLISPAPNGLVLAGKTRYGAPGINKGSYATVVRKYDYAGQTEISNQDAALVQVESLDSTLVRFSNYYELTFQNLTFQVQNLSDSVLNRVNINVEFPPYEWDCLRFYQMFSQKFDSLNLQPGQTTELVWEELKVKFEEDPAGPMELCFWTSIPNQKIDINPSNDFFCTQTDIPTDIEAIDRLSNFQFEIYPNPAVSGSTISFKVPVNLKVEVRIFNNLGQQMEAFNLNRSSGSLALNQYPPGLYYASLIIEGQIIRSAKFIQL